MELRYIAILTVGKPDIILERIIKSVQKQRLANRYPIVKVEKSSRRQFYLFLGAKINDISSVEEIFYDVRNILKFAGLSSNPCKDLLTLKDIRPMVSNAEVSTHRLNSLNYKIIEYEDFEDPFEFYDSEFLIENCQDNSLKYDQLLYWLSCVGRGSWQQLVDACKTLELLTINNTAAHILRRFIVLGYLETSDNGNTWCICPTYLLQSPINKSIFILCGQRTPYLLNKLSKYGKLDLIIQPNSLGPTCVKFQFNDIDFSRHTWEIDPNVSIFIRKIEDMVNITPNISEWSNSLLNVENINIANYLFAKWNGTEYNSCSDIYEKDGHCIAKSGLYRLSNNKSKRKFSMVLFFNYEKQVWLKGDWYGLRFLDNLNNGVTNINYFNEKKNKLIILRQSHWPLLFERILVLSSGFLPIVNRHSNWLVYPEISTSILSMLVEKMDIEYKEVSKNA